MIFATILHGYGGDVKPQSCVQLMLKAKIRCACPVSRDLDHIFGIARGHILQLLWGYDYD